MSIAPGTVVGSRFVIEEVAGRGGMGVVYRAIDRASGRTVALKAFDGAMAVERAPRESASLAKVTHPGIVEHIAHGATEAGAPYLVMEWLVGEDLGARLERGALTIDEALLLGEGLASALAAAHAVGIVHRDIKPSNIMLVGGDIARTKLLDFGLAHERGTARFTQVGHALGTPAYMAPEHARGVDVDARADLFSLGILLYEGISGQVPFDAEHPLAIMAKVILETAPPLVSPYEPVPTALAALIEELLAKEASKRPASTEGVALRLGELRRRRSVGRSQSVAVVDDPSRDGTTSASLGRRELRVSSVLFVAALGPDAVSDLRSDESGFYDGMFAQITRHGARLEQLLDGSFLVLMPEAEAIADQATRAARCALEVHAMLPKHPMVLVTGRAERGEKIPLGEVLDRGARLLSARSRRRAFEGVGLDEATAGLVDRRFTVQGEGLDLALVAERTALVRDRSALVPAHRFMGRDEDLAWLVARSTSAGPATATQVAGAAGAGKSRLLEELVSALNEMTIMSARGDVTLRESPLGVVAKLCGRLFDIDVATDADDARRRIRARVGRHVAPEDVDRLAAFMSELVGVPCADDAHPLLPLARVDRVRMGDQIRAAWDDLLAAELSAGSLLVIVDDFEHADAPSLSLLSESLRNHRDGALRVILFGRSETSLTWPLIERRRLAPLDSATMHAIARSALGDSATPPVVARMVEQAEGVPFALEELVRAELEGRGHRTPPTLIALAQARIETLSDELRHVLRACSVFGNQFCGSDIAALTGRSEATAVENDLLALASVEVLTRITGTTPARFAFRTALLREAAYATLTDEDRELGHRLAGEWLSTHAQDRDAVVVAHHFDLAGDVRRAGIWFARSADIALEANAFEQAAELAERGALAGASGPLLGRLRVVQTEAFRHAGRNADMRSAGAEALKVCPARTPPWWIALADTVLGAIRLGDKAQVAELGATAATPPFADLPAAAARAAHYLHFAGQKQSADVLLHAASQRIGAFGEDPGRWAWAYRAHATKALLAGELGGYLTELQQAVRAFASSGDVRELAQERVNVGFARVELGLYEEAEVVLRDAIIGAERLGLHHVVASGQQNLGSAIARQARFHEGETWLRVALETFVQQRNARMEGNTRTNLSRLWLARGEAAKALACAREAAKTLDTVPPLLPAALACASRALLALDATEEALRLARDAAARLATLGQIDDGEAIVHLALADALHRNGSIVDAKYAIGVARDRLLARAASIREPKWRDSFLQRVAENRRTLELAAQWI